MREGDWVITKANVFGKNIKAVSILIEERPDCYITIGAKRYVGAVFVVPKKNVTLMKSTLTTEDIDSLIDLALDLKDKKWFDQLVNMKQRIS